MFNQNIKDQLLVALAKTLTDKKQDVSDLKKVNKILECLADCCDDMEAIKSFDLTKECEKITAIMEGITKKINKK